MHRYTQRQEKQEKKTEKGLKKEVKTTLEGETAIEAELHAGSQGCSRERATWLPPEKDNLEVSEEDTFIPGAPLHACRPDEQVENKAESSWHDLAKQGKKPNQALVCP